MKNYRITVNGTACDVAVEELGAGAAPAAVAAPAPVHVWHQLRQLQQLQPQQALSRLQLQCQVRS